MIKDGASIRNVDEGSRAGRWINGGLVLLLALHCGLLGWGAWQHSPTWDEVGHLAAGLSHWQCGDFDLYRVNPPLVRMVATLPVLVLRPQVVSHDDPTDPRGRPEMTAGGRLLRADGEAALRYLAVARWACIPFSILGAWICFRWATELYGRAAGLTAVSLWCFCPNILANAQMITSDVGAAAFAVTSAYAFWHWLKGPDWGGALIAGTALGIAQLTKTTLVVFFVLWPSIWFVWRYGSRSEPSARLRLVKQGAQLIAILGLSVYVINLGYGFVGSGERLGDLPFISRFLTAESGPSGDGLRVNRFAGTWLGALRVPVPRDYALGIDRQRFDFERGYWSYLAGEWRFGGWWYYYLYSLGIKVPLGTWGLGLSALAVTFLARGYPRVSRDEILLLMPAVAVLSLVSSQTGFSHHMRYVLPIFPFAFIWISKAGPLAHRSRVSASLTSAALAWSFASSLWIYPHSLSYFNEAVGGPMGGHAHLLNSNIDWGQDLLYLKRWIDGHPEAKRIALAYSLPGPLLDPKDLGLEYTLPPSGPQSTPGDWPIVTWATGPLPGWYALCVNRIRDWDNQYAYFLRFKPVATAGYSIYIYHFTLGDANRVRQELRLPELTIAGKEGGE